MTTSGIHCLNCAADVAASSTACSKCGHPIARGRYEQLATEARPAFLYGYLYRKSYERAGETRFLLGWDETWQFVALAIASGIIGNAAWDIVKAAIGRVLTSTSRRSLSPGPHPAAALLDNAEFELAVRYTREYLDGGSAIPEEVARALREEQLATEVAPLLLAISRGEAVIGSREEAELKVRGTLRIPMQSPTGDFCGLWADVELER